MSDSKAERQAQRSGLVATAGGRTIYRPDQEAGRDPDSGAGEISGVPFVSGEDGRDGEDSTNDSEEDEEDREMTEKKNDSETKSETKSKSKSTSKSEPTMSIDEIEERLAELRDEIEKKKDEALGERKKLEARIDEIVEARKHRDLEREEMLVYAGIQLMKVLRGFEDLKARFRGLVPRAQVGWDRVVTSIAVTSTLCWVLLLLLLQMPSTRTEMLKRAMTEDEGFAYVMALEALEDGTLMDETGGYDASEAPQQ